MSRSSAFAVLALSGCFSPEPPDGAFTCNPGARPCPSGYYCATSNTCWKLGHDAGIVGCANASVALCEDFGSGRIDPATWSTVQIQGSLTVDSARAHRGSYSLHAHTNAYSGTSMSLNAQLQETKTFPALAAG